MKKMTKVLAIIIAMTMIISLFPVSSLARTYIRPIGGGSGITFPWLGGLFRGEPEEPEEPEEPAEPEEEPVEEETSPVILPYSTVGSEALDVSAVSYSADVGVNALGANEKVAYLPVTLFNYDTDAINASTHQAEIDAIIAAGGNVSDLTEWSGLYFNGGNPAASESYTYGDGNVTTVESWVPVALEDIVSGNSYVIVSNGGNQALTDVGSNSLTGTALNETAGESITRNNATMASAISWTVQANGSYYYLTRQNGTRTEYMTVSRNAAGTSTSATRLTLSAVPNTTNGIYIGNQTGTRWLRQSNTSHTGASAKNDNSIYYLYEVGSSVSTTAETTAALPYADHNFWTGKLTGDSGNRTWSGLANSTLVNGDIDLVNPDPGIFTLNDVPGKTVYTNVGMPFAYNANTATYTFKSNIYAAYGSDNGIDGDGVLSDTNLIFNADLPQDNGTNNGSGNTTNWLPFNDDVTAYNSSLFVNEADTDYHFGMKAQFTFTMTETGSYSTQAGTTVPMTFRFSGDDDVWVFVDNKLVLDLGGIHNSMGGTINFAENTWEIGIGDDNTATGTVGVYNDANAALSGSVFKTVTTNGDGTTTTTNGDVFSNTTLSEFALQGAHTLSIFFLERGKGASNAQISFNLLVQDILSVSKNLYAEGATTPATGTSSATFGFKVHNVVTGATGTIDNVLTNVRYTLKNRDGSIVGTTHAVEADGTFYLRNGQTATFVITDSGTSTFYVEELALDETVYNTPQWSVVTNNGTAATGSAISSPSSSALSANSLDKVNFVCNNYYMNVATVHPMTSVLDFGLPVIYDVLPYTSQIATVNGEPTLTEFTRLASLGSYRVVDKLTGEITNPDFHQVQDDNGYGTITIVKYDEATGEYVPASLEAGDFDIGAEVSDTYNTHLYIKYELYSYLTDVVNIPYTVRADNGEYVASQIKIVPATNMYYEESFPNADAPVIAYSDYVMDAAAIETIPDTFGWRSVGTPDVMYQEDGIIQNTTVNYSSYGTDTAYINGSHTDSAGTSVQMRSFKTFQKDENGDDTTTLLNKGKSEFTVDFAGTGADLYFRTNKTSGLIAVTIYAYPDDNPDGVVVGAARFIIDTIYKGQYKDAEGNIYEYDWAAEGLYGIPVVSTETLLTNYIKYSEANKIACEPYCDYNATDDVYSLKYGNYSVFVTMSYPTVDNGGRSEINFDGVRIFNPLDTIVSSSSFSSGAGTANDSEITANDAYTSDSELDPYIVSLRDKMISDRNAANYSSEYDALFIDEAGAVTAFEDFINYGPKNEVYLYAGQSLSFYINDWSDATSNAIKKALYLGMKSPTSTGCVVSMNNVGETNYLSFNINTAMDCYYDISNAVKIVSGSATGTEGNRGSITLTVESGFLSITTLKTNLLVASTADPDANNPYATASYFGQNIFTESAEYEGSAE